MEKDYFIVKNDMVKNKLEELFLLSTKDSFYTLNLELKNLSFGEKNDTTEKIDKCINDFLELLRKDCVTASYCLDRLLDVIIDNISIVYGRNSIKRLTCILSILYGFQFSKTNVSYDFTSLEKVDKGFLRTVFFNKNDYYGLERIIYSYRVFDTERCSEELPTIESAQVMYEVLIDIIHKYSNRAKNRISNYCDVYSFVKSTYIGRSLRVLIPDFSNYIERTLLQLAFFNYNRNQSQNHESKEQILKHESKEQILKKEKELSTTFLHGDYHDICFLYAWFYRIESRKQSLVQREESLKKALRYIDKAKTVYENEADESKKKYNFVEDSDILLQKSAIQSEMKMYNDAYETMISVITNPKNMLKKWKNSAYFQIWITSHYLRLKALENNTGEINTAICHLDNYIMEYLSELKEFKPIVQFINSNSFLKENSIIRTNLYSKLLILISYSNLILHKSTISDVSGFKILYYTTEKNLRFLLEDEDNPKVQYRLPLFHANHMNDPEEGKILKTILENGINKKDLLINASHKREKYEENYVFLKSFFCVEKDKLSEFLPMWIQYGNDAKGVCVILDECTFEGVDLLKVNYLGDDGKCGDDVMDELIQNYKIAYENIISLCNNELKNNDECREKIQDLVEYINSRIIFLFKHKSYKHESEVRVIVSRTNSELDDVKTIPGNVPKMYLYNEHQTFIDEIILGSKMRIPDNYVPFIHYHGRKMWANNDKKKQITVSNSSIQYR